MWSYFNVLLFNFTHIHFKPFHYSLHRILAKYKHFHQLHLSSEWFNLFGCVSVYECQGKFTQFSLNILLPVMVIAHHWCCEQVAKCFNITFSFVDDTNKIITTSEILLWNFDSLHSLYRPCALSCSSLNRWIQVFVYPNDWLHRMDIKINIEFGMVVRIAKLMECGQSIEQTLTWQENNWKILAWR